MSAAMAYLRRIDETMRATGYVADCVTHAAVLAEHLVSEGLNPWIARIRDLQPRDGSVFFGPLTPLRFRGGQALTWNTHYVCCSSREVWDPLAGEVLNLDLFTTAVFGRHIPEESFLSPAHVRERLLGGTFRRAFHPDAARDRFTQKSPTA